MVARSFDSWLGHLAAAGLSKRPPSSPGHSGACVALPVVFLHLVATDRRKQERPDMHPLIAIEARRGEACNAVPATKAPRVNMFRS